jgi:hypothetical protein
MRLKAYEFERMLFEALFRRWSFVFYSGLHNREPENSIQKLMCIGKNLGKKSQRL